ncbi:MAG TPA: hypothetical protein VGO34_05785 [Alphaproteobacteria bacterium]|jgi:hypothetical protein
MKKLIALLAVLAAGYGLYRYMTWHIDVDVTPVESAESLAAPKSAPPPGSSAVTAEQSLDLPGVYLANREGVTDILELHPDGSYSRNYRSPEGALIHQGQWERVGDHIAFTNFAVAPDEDVDGNDTWRTSRREWSARLVMGRSEVQIVINAEKALLYTKRG